MSHAIMLIAGFLLTGTGHAAGLATYRPVRTVRGTIRVWGAPRDGRLIEQLESGFSAEQPGVRFETTLHGPESTFASVNMGVADVAFMAREILVPLESMAFEWLHHYAPVVVPIANAGVGADRVSYDDEVNLAFVVNKRNPLVCLTLSQADAIFSAGRRPPGEDLRHWGQIGLTDVWAARPIHVYGPPVDSAAARYVRIAVSAGSRKWTAGYRTIRGDWRMLLAAVARDPDGIAYAPTIPGNPNVRALALSAQGSGSCYPLDVETVRNRRYPLVRTIDVVLDRPPGTATDPKVQEFLRYVLSDDGQVVIAGNDVYIPLDAASAGEELRRLE